jgi:predicted esterase
MRGMGTAHYWRAIRQTIPILLVFSLSTSALAASITRETLRSERDTRTYYMLIPDSVGPKPVPLVITLHGSGRDGRPLVELFRGLAEKEQVIVVGPDAIDRGGWQVPADGPALLYLLIEAIKTKHAIDGRRVYLFGHSAGASFALSMGLMESQYVAGVAAHAVALQEAGRDRLLAAPRKVPIVLFHGTSDDAISIDAARRTKEALVKAGFPVVFRELPGYQHNTIYTRGDTIVEPAWAFLKDQVLDAEPRYQAYSYPQR